MDYNISHELMRGLVEGLNQEGHSSSFGYSSTFFNKRKDKLRECLGKAGTKEWKELMSQFHKREDDIKQKDITENERREYERLKSKFE